MQLIQQRPELPARHRVDAGRRFVEQQKLRLRLQRSHERELLLHPARQRASQTAPESIHTDAREKIGGARLRSVIRNTVQLRPEIEVLVNGEVLVKREPLRHESERERAIDIHGAGRRLQQSGDDAEERRLPRAVGTDDAEQLALLDPKGQVIERRLRPELAR